MKQKKSKAREEWQEKNGKRRNDREETIEKKQERRNNRNETIEKKQYRRNKREETIEKKRERRNERQSLIIKQKWYKEKNTPSLTANKVVNFILTACFCLVFINHQPLYITFLSIPYHTHHHDAVPELRDK